ncbi:hypothetical protein [uncultured Winogradskyella sp.]|uniref:hypothetical protein n=1 Tax=uncultured Winogradskyella sp. TaxID=395353 RepID=UPI00261C1818|nr:hypothetical protein [uncultured Winogradskyella sp.]
MKFDKIETRVLLNAIREYRGREGNFSSSDPIVDVTGKLSEENDFNNSELKNILTVINENITFLKKYEYKGLTVAQGNKNREDIVVPLEEIKVKINKVI